MRLVDLPNKILHCGRLKLDLSQPHIMGILNVTPDSFSDGGLHHEKAAALHRARQMIDEGAAIIDIGGESTRPGAAPVSLQQELDRVLPVVEGLANDEVILSIDTSSPEVIRHAVAAGAHIWNDVRGLKRSLALETAAALNVPVIIMHMRGEPDTMNQLAQYDDVTQEVIHELQVRIDVALQAGVLAQNIIIDPGFGFAKNTQHNLQLLNEFSELTTLGYPILSGLSRKRFIGEALGGVETSERLIGSVMGHMLSIQQGASMVRTHDVKAMRDAIRVWSATCMKRV